MAKIRDGSTYLGQHLVHSDYYSENERVVGQWTGQAAGRLGLAGRDIKADDAAFEHLRRNRLPDGSGRLTPRDAENRICYLDFQVSAQKSVSIMALTVGDERLIAGHRRAAAKGYAELERFAACQNNTHWERQNRITGNLCAARFSHTASRALDPQLHDHFVTANATFDAASGEWRALTEREMLSAIRYAGKTYQNELAVECRQLGYELDEIRDGKGAITGFEIRGVPEAVRQRFSKRRKEVEAGIAKFEKEHGRAPTVGEIHVITTETRSAKLAEASTEQVGRWQRAELSAAELRQLESVKQAAISRTQHEVEIPGGEREALRRAVSHLFERRSVVPEHEILAEALNQQLGAVQLDRLKAVMEHEPQLVRLAEGGSLSRPCATRKGLAEEKWAVHFVTESKGRFERLGGVEKMDQKLSDEQRTALVRLLGSPDQVMSLRGAAGVGKTTALDELRRMLERNGKSVLAVAPTTSATDVLRKEGFKQATTVAAFLAQDGKPSAMPPVLLVDEAGLLSNKQGTALLRWAEANHGRVIFIGDTRQHSGVEAGDFLRVLEKHSPLERAEIGQVRRQQGRAYRDAVQTMAGGSVRAGMEKLDELGWVREGKADYLANAAAEYVQRTRPDAERVLCVCPTWAENHALTAEIRQRLRADGKLGQGRNFTVHDSLSWTEIQRENSHNYKSGLLVTFNKKAGGFDKGSTWEVVAADSSRVELRNGQGEQRSVDVKKTAKAFDVGTARVLEMAPGDWVLLRDNDRKAGLVNGKVHQVKSIAGDVLHLADGSALDTRRFSRFLHGYAITSHKAQGLTAAHVVVAASRLDAKAAYVACSRGKLSCTIHTPDKPALLRSFPAGDRLAALDRLPPVLESPAVSNRLAAFQSVAKMKIQEFEERLSLSLAAWQLPVCRQVLHWLKQLMPSEKEPPTKEQEIT